MRSLFIATAALLTLAITPASAQQRAVTGAVIGAGAGAVIAGPVGAVAGGAAGAVIGGPRISRSRSCWRDRNGRRHCRYR